MFHPIDFNQITSKNHQKSFQRPILTTIHIANMTLKDLKRPL